VAILSSSWGSSRLLCIEMPAALRYFRVVILIQIGVERNERVVEKIAPDPDPSGVAQDLVAGTTTSLTRPECRSTGSYQGWQGSTQTRRP